MLKQNTFTERQLILFFMYLVKNYDDTDIFYTFNPQPMEDIFSSPDRSDEMDSLLFTKSDNPDCTLRLCALQKLTVCSQSYVFSFFYQQNKAEQVIPRKSIYTINVKQFCFS